MDGVEESFVFEKESKINAKIVYNLDIFKGMTDDEIYSDIMEKVKEINASLPQFKKINEIAITSRKLEKTQTGKIQRNIELKKTKENKKEDIMDSYTNTIFERVEKILIDKLGNKPINKESNIILDLGADSLDMVEIILAIEKEFNIKIDKENRRNVIKVKDLIDIINIK